MSRSEATLEELFCLLPDLEELELLRLALVGAAIPNPGKEWDGSSAYATIDKRIVTVDRVESAIEESEKALHEYVSSLHERLRPLFRSFWTGKRGESSRQLVELGERQEKNGQYRKARHCYDVALATALPLPDKDPQILALRRIARVALAQGDLHEAFSYYQRSAELACDAGNTHAEIIARTGLGNVRLWQGRWAEAESCYRVALALVDQVEDRASVLLERAQLYNNLGTSATRQMRLDEADAWFAQALDLWQTLSSQFDLAVCYHNTALLREVQGRREEARQIYQHALSLPIPSGMWAGIAIDLAESYLRDEHVSQAEQWGRAAEDRAIATRSPYFLGRMYHGRGTIVAARGDDGGFTFFEKALQIAHEKEFPLLEGEILVDYALLRLQTGEVEEAQAYLERARDIFIGLGAVHEQERAEQALIKVSSSDEIAAAAE